MSIFRILMSLFVLISFLIPTCLMAAEDNPLNDEDQKISNRKGKKIRRSPANMYLKSLIPYHLRIVLVNR